MLPDVFFIMEPPENTVSQKFPAILSSLADHLHPFLYCFRRLPSTFHSGGGVALQLHALIFWSTLAVIFMLSSLYVKKMKFKKRDFASFQSLTLSPIVRDHALLKKNQEDVSMDAIFAEELQVQEALLASFVASQMASNASSSRRAGDRMDSGQVKINQKTCNPPQSFCEICLENKDRWQMFQKGCCAHTFCYECISKHIEAKIHENVAFITCPAVNCDAALDIDVCRLIIPKDALVRWDELLCTSSIPDSQKLYCPFKDCSALLVDDSRGAIKKVNCPFCKRAFCAACRVPWHTEFSCKEFQTLNAKKGGKEDVMVTSLAKKKNWQKCPHCKMYVEKSEGCVHMTCRCGHEFCYSCGANWTGSHRGCRRKS